MNTKLAIVTEDTREMHAFDMFPHIATISADLATNCALMRSWARRKVLNYILIKLLFSLAIACKENESWF